MKPIIPLAIVGLGILLLATSTVWAKVFPPTRSWTPEKAMRSGEVKDRLATLGLLINSPNRRIHNGPDPATLKAEFNQLEKENAQLNADFESAYQSPNTASKILKWSGISLAAFGIIGWYASQQSD